jgi:hypothetical protein
MATAKLTLLGIESDLNYLNKSLFDSLSLPSGYEKADIVNQILLDCGEFEVLYPSGDFLTEAIGLWSKRWYRTFNKWLTALNIEYAPLENYDRTEEHVDTFENINENHNQNKGTDTSTEKVSAFDSSNFSNKGQSITNLGTGSDSNGSGSGSSTSKIRAHGNIGVTTSQQMLEAELDLAKWNLTKHIVDIFKQEFCIMVYS